MNDLRELNFDVGLLVPFYHVAHAGSIAQGAERLGATRPAVSRQITILEDQLGFRVFESGPRAARLTEAGARLLQLVKRQMRELNDCVFTLRDRHAPKISVGSASAFARSHWPAVLKDLLAIEPQVEPVVVDAPEDVLLRQLAKGQLQLIIIPLAHAMPPHFVRVSLITLPMAFLVPKSWRIRSTDELKAAHRQVPYRAALPITSQTMIGILTKHLRLLGIKLGPTSWCSLSDVLPFVASEAGIGLSVLEPSLVTHPKVSVFPIKTWEPIEIGVVYRAPGTALELRVVELLKIHAAKLQAVLVKKNRARKA